MASDGISASASTVRSLHPPPLRISVSPPSSTVPSPHDSPSDSMSSLPSVSSSYFFSSAAASPPHAHSHPHSDQGRDLTTQGFIIPSLTLPDALKRPTLHGQTVGDIRLLVLGSQDAGKSFLTGMLLEDNEDVVDVGAWEDVADGCGKLLRASTDWIEHRDGHGLEKFEPTRNVEIVELPGYDVDADGSGGDDLLQRVKSLVETPFHALSSLFRPHTPHCSVLVGLVAAPSTPLYTALVFLLSSAPTPLDELLINGLGDLIPIIVLPSHRIPSGAGLSSFRPTSAVALRTGLFHSPDTLALLRHEAADRYLRWREVERAVGDIQASQHQCKMQKQRNLEAWEQSQWEMERMMSSFSRDVARRLRRQETATTTTTTTATIRERERERERPAPATARHAWDRRIGRDPLHLASLVMFSVSLLGPVRAHVRRSMACFWDKLGDAHVQMALVGGFCVGVGIGIFVR